MKNKNYKVIWIGVSMLIVGICICGCTSSNSSSQSSTGTRKSALVEGVSIAGSFDELSLTTSNQVKAIVRAGNIGTVNSENVKALITIKEGTSCDSGKTLGTTTINFGALPARGSPKIITTTIYLSSTPTGHPYKIYTACLSSDTPGVWLSKMGPY
jgi:hypothetical protein